MPLNLADRAAIVDIATERRPLRRRSASYPYGAGDPARRQDRAWSRNETTGTVSVDRPRRRREGRQDDPGRRAPLAPRGDRASTRRRQRAYVAVANTDQVAVIDTDTHSSSRSLERSRRRRGRHRHDPERARRSRTATALLVAERGADELAVFGAADG